MKLYDCNCEFAESTNNANSSVKGYILVSECDDCAAKRETENTVRLAKEQEKQVIIEQEAIAKESAKAKLIALGLNDAEIEALIK